MWWKAGVTGLVWLYLHICSPFVSFDELFTASRNDGRDHWRLPYRRRLLFLFMIIQFWVFLLMFCSRFVLAPPAEPFHRAEETVLLCCCNDYRVETSKEREKGTEGRVEIKWKNTVNKNMLQVPHHTYPTCTNKWKHTSPDQSRGWKHLWRSTQYRIISASSNIKAILLEFRWTL